MQDCAAIISSQANGCCSITRDNLGPYKVKVLVIPTVYLVTTMVRILLKSAQSSASIMRATHVTVATVIEDLCQKNGIFR